MPKSEVESNLWAYDLKVVCFILGFYYFYENILEGYGVIYIDLRSKYGSWALVAGASEGLGAAYAEALAHCGLNLILVARREQKLRELAASLNKKYKVEVLTHALDLADIASVTEALEKDSLEIGVLVYNAAYAPIGSFSQIDPEKLEMVVDVNVKGPLLLSKYISAQMIKRQRGAIILMSSLARNPGQSQIGRLRCLKGL